jgi:hypothetical protein
MRCTCNRHLKSDCASAQAVGRELKVFVLHAHMHGPYVQSQEPVFLHLRHIHMHDPNVQSQDPLALSSSFSFSLVLSRPHMHGPCVHHRVCVLCVVLL